MFHTDQQVGDEVSQRQLYAFNGGLLFDRRIKRILTLAGYKPKIGWPSGQDMVGVWGHSPTAGRGQNVAEKTGACLLRVEDAFLRSIHTGRDGDRPLGLCIDHKGMHFDPAQPSDLETLLASHPLDNHALLQRAKSCMQWLKDSNLSKYNTFDLTLPAPKPGYVLIIDQTRSDAAITASRANANTFREMLYYAQEEHPNAHILIKTHPETQAGHRQGYFDLSDCNERVSLCDEPYSPHQLFEGAIAVYTVSSQLGFEAILHGHNPVVFGQPFYMGWGLSDDRQPLDRRQRKLTRAQLFAAAMMLYPVWYDPYFDCLCELEDVLRTLDAQARAWREDHKGWVAVGLRHWKKRPIQAFFGQETPVIFRTSKAVSLTKGQRKMVWSSSCSALEQREQSVTRLEDGFLRSRGLGADLIAPMSLACDDLGIYYDPKAPSRLEVLIEGAAHGLRPDQRERAERLLDDLREANLSKYNIGHCADLQKIEYVKSQGRTVILVPGQVEDDASIKEGTTEVCTNQGLLEEVRRAHPEAYIVYKPHPDVEAGLRLGRVECPERYANEVLRGVDPIYAISLVDEVWTLTSLIGFEALIRNVPVTCLGMPFYAGWGLTTDKAEKPPRRCAMPDLTALVYAALISYPRYYDPKTKQPCPVEVVVDRLKTNDIKRPSPANRALAKLQGVFSGYAHLWRA